MAYRQQRQNGPPAHERDDRRPAPGQLRTQGHKSNQRFSYAETPVQMQPAVFQQFSSPTNSTIEESPRTPVNHEPMPNISEDDRRSPYPEEKALPNRVESPYNFPPPQGLHPANFAPYAEISPVDSQPVSSSYPLSALTPQAQPTHHWQPQRSIGSKSSSTPLLSAPSTDRKHETRQISMPPMTPRTPTYNPHSLTGPNDVTDNHRPGQVAHPNSVIDPEWKHGMCELDTLCCLGLVCPCMVYGKTQYRLAQKAQRREATDLLGYKASNGSCGLMALACGVQCTYLCGPTEPC